MLSSIIFLVLVVVLYYLYTKYGKTSPYNLMPKGPKPIHICGNIFQVVLKPHLMFSKWAYKYGKLYTLNLFGTPALVVNDAKTMKQIFGSIESTGKFRIPVFDKLDAGTFGVFGAEGEVWQEVRKFTMKALRECGISKSSVVETAVWHSLAEVLEWFEQADKNGSGVVFPLRERFIDALGNIIWNIANRSGPNCTKSGMGKLIVKWVDALQTTTKSGLLFLPWLQHIAPEWCGYNGFLQACTDVINLIDKYFEERKQYRKAVKKVEAENRNLLDAYLDQWENCTEANSCFYGEAGWKHCFYSVMNFLIAGGETTATTLNWLVNYLVACPNVQQKVYEEVNKVLGNEMPVLMETKRLPYLEAVIYETLRMSSLVPLGMILRLLDNVKFEEHYLPKNTLLIANIYHAHNDKSVWRDPENFRPERFLEVDEIEKMRLKQCVVGFQAGKRICPGEGLAKDVMFLVTARLVQKFQFLPVLGKTPDEYITPEPGFFLLPKQIGVKIKARQ